MTSFAPTRLLTACCLLMLSHLGLSRSLAPGDSVTAPSAALKLVARQFTFTEGPAVDKKGDVYFTDQPNDKIWRYDTKGNLSVYMDKTGRANGLYVDAKGNLLACADENNELWSISPAKRVTVLLKNYQGKHFNGPNDLWITPKGGIYFTDPLYPRDYWTHKMPELAGQHVYYLPKGAAEARIVDSTLVKPNGIVGSPDGKTLYVADAGAGKTYRYTIQPDGRLTDRQLFVEQGSDGMTIDQRGNVYLSGRGVTIYSPAGVKLQVIPVPARWVGNLCFSGADRRTLFITATDAIFTIAMQVRGVE
ncbi:SMP-30/gluconolactonase/LRE family protein [Fibrella sp. WM1]|uniref:SMP-30/gluconolactonase/LRE family protein n=1 Tax=Fibrella musci TaxID=3242485 RepID=UPI0035218CC1